MSKRQTAADIKQNPHVWYNSVSNKKGLMNIRVSKLREAAEFLVDILNGKWIPSSEVYRLAVQAGIADRTLQYARRALHVKAKKIGGAGWVMSLPENAHEYLDGINARSTESAMRLSEKGAVSSDFVRVEILRGLEAVAEC